MIPVFRPRLPLSDKVVPYLQAIDERRWYTNQGPLLIEFERRLASHFATEPEQVTTSANATLALMLALAALDVKPGSFCVMPSWTFAATPAAAVWAGLKPYFVDVEEGSWEITPDHVKALGRTHEIGAVIAVSSFGAPLDLDRWNAFVAETGIPAVIDAAAGFDGFAGCGPRVSNVPVVISLHATKVSGIGEGAVTITGDAHVADKLKMLGNFGFRGSRNALLPGINAKLSEYAAAVGLAFLDGWDDTRSEWTDLSRIFKQEILSTRDVRPAPQFGDGWVSSYGLIELPSWIAAEDMMAELRQLGVESRQWWGRGCHRHTAYRACERTSLPQTERLASAVLGLPFWLGLDDDVSKDVFEKVREVLRFGKNSFRRAEESNWAQ